MLECVVVSIRHSNLAVNVAIVKNLVAVKGPKVAVNFAVGGSEGLPRSGNTGQSQYSQTNIKSRYSRIP
jgi:hypothetical protein